MANRKRGDNLQHSDDEESQPQSENTDNSASEDLESCNVESVTEENDDVETENNDGQEDIDRNEIYEKQVIIRQEANFKTTI